MTMNTDSALAPAWPWPPAQANVCRSVSTLLKVLRGLPALEWEVSCKLSPGGILPGRLVTGISPRGVSRRYFDQLPRTFGIPPEVASIFAAEWPRCQRIYLAFEAGLSSTVMKVYLEYPRPMPSRTVSPFLVIRGFKWKMRPEPEWYETEYWCLNGLSIAGAQNYLLKPDPLNPEQVFMYARLADILTQTHRKAGDWRHFQMLVARESSSPRNALGLRFYDSGLTVGKLSADLTALANHWSLPADDIQHFIAVAGNREVGWLHAGTGTDALPFLTLYCAASRADAQTAMLLSG